MQAEVHSLKLWTESNKAWGSLLTNGEPRRSQHALSGGLHPNLQDRGNWEFSHRDEKQMSPSFCLVAPTLFLSPSLSSSQTWPSVHPPGTGEEHEHHGKGGRPWARSHDEGALFFVGGTAWATELWAHGAGPRALQLSHGKTQTRFDINVMFWRFPLKTVKRWLTGRSRWTGDAFTWLFCSQCWRRVWPLTSGSKSTHGDQTRETGPRLLFSSCLWSWYFHYKSLDCETPPHAPAAPLGPGFLFPRAQPLGHCCSVLTCVLWLWA